MHSTEILIAIAAGILFKNNPQASSLKCHQRAINPKIALTQTFFAVEVLNFSALVWEDSKKQGLKCFVGNKMYLNNCLTFEKVYHYYLWNLIPEYNKHLLSAYCLLG